MAGLQSLLSRFTTTGNSAAGPSRDPVQHSEPPTVRTPNATDAPVVDTLTGRRNVTNFASPVLQEATMPASLRALAPTSAPAVWALCSTRIPGGGFVAASSGGLASHLDPRGEVLQEFHTHGAVYSLCMLDEHHVLGNVQVSSANYALQVWDLRTNRFVGQSPAPTQYTAMAHLGQGMVVATYHQVGRPLVEATHQPLPPVWLHNLAEGDVRHLEGVSADETVDHLTVLGRGHVAACVRPAWRTGKTSSIITWRDDRDWQAQRVPVPAEVTTLKTLVPLDADRLLALGNDTTEAAVWHINKQQWQALNPDFGTIVGHRWVEQSPEHAAECAQYDRSMACGGVNPRALSHWEAHLLLERRGGSNAVWDLHHGTPAWQGTSLVEQPSGPTFGATLRVLALT